MNGLTVTAPSTSIRIITIVVVGICVNGTIGVVTLSACMVLETKPDPTLVTAYVGLTAALVGALTGLLVNTRTQAGTVEPTPPTPPLPVTVENKPSEPVPTTDTDKTKPSL